MSNRVETVERYIEGFRRSDHAMVLACLTDDVVWVLPGYKHLEGKVAFDGEIEGEGFEGSPELEVHRFIEGPGEVVALGTGRGRRTDGGEHRFAWNDVVTFRGDLICRVESYVVPEPGLAP